MAASRWYPSKDQLSTPEQLERALRQVLTQHYSLQDRHNDLRTKVETPVASTAAPASGPATTKLLGLDVAPVDTQTLADGATLKFVKKNNNFQFS